jgi:nucleolar protein TMA23
MDTAAYLTRQGWLGAGRSLHPTGRGIGKPLLVSRKPNVLGIGKKKNDAYADQWWARAFDSSLKDLNVSKSPVTGATEAVTAEAWSQLDMIKASGGKWAGGLYSGFVKGEGLQGTLTPELPHGEKMVGLAMQPEVSGQKRKKGDGNEELYLNKQLRHEEKQLRKEGRRILREARQIDGEEKRLLKSDDAQGLPVVVSAIDLDSSIIQCTQITIDKAERRRRRQERRATRTHRRESQHEQHNAEKPNTTTSNPRKDE